MSERCISINRDEVPWGLWVYLCTRAGVDCYKTHGLLIYASRVIGYATQAPPEEGAET